MADGDISLGMPASEVRAVVDVLRAAGFDRVWIAGGWGVDALVGRQTRHHRDLDLAVDVTCLALDRLLRALARRSYRVETDWRPSRVELVAPGARFVDVHPVVFDAHGIGWQANIDGKEPFRYSEGAFTRGVIPGRAVDCLSAALQLQFHSGYPPRDHDLHDIALLESLPGPSGIRQTHPKSHD